MSAAQAIDVADFVDAIDRRIQESIENTDYGWNTVATRGDASATYTGGQSGAKWWRATPQIYDLDEGRYYPYYVEERDLEEMRAKARHLGTFTSVATGALQALSVYTMGGEWEYKFAGKRDAPQQPSPQLLAELNAVLQATLERNQWIGDLDCEIHDTSRQDGDVVVSGYAAPDGICDFRRLSADLCKQPANPKRLNDWLDVSPQNSWTFGVHTIYDERMRRIDHERAIGLHIVYDDGGKNWDYLPAWPQQHGDDTLCGKFGHLIKRNTPRSAKRGITDYWPVQTDLEREAKLSENLAVGAAVMASIPWFENYAKGTTRDQAEAAMTRGLDTYEKAIANSRGRNITETRNVQTRAPGTIVKASQGIERTMGPLGQVRQPIYIEVCQHLLRSVGLRWLMPEYMISGDASNANFASTLVSESPFVKARECDQRFYIAHFKAILWKAIKVAYDRGRFQKFPINFAGIVALCDLQIQPPMVASRDKANHLAELNQLWTAGLLSGNEYRLDLKREPKPEYEEKTYEAPMLPGQIQNGLAAMATGGKQPPGEDDPGGQPAKPEPPKPGGGQGDKGGPPAGPDRKEQLRAEAFSRAIESAQTLGEARAIAGRFRVAVENCGTGDGGFQPGNDCQCDDCAGGGELEDYTTDKFQDVNSALRSGNVDKSTADFVKRLDATIAKAPKRAGVTLRSFDIEGEDGKKIAAMLTEGGTFTDAAYMSTRKTPTLTDSIAFKQKKMAAGQVVLRVEGKSGVDISAISKNPGEGEILYPRGTTFAVRKVHRTESGGILAEIVEQPKAKESRVLEDCGANAEGGGGFQAGNTCGDDEGDGTNADAGKADKQTETPEFKAWFGDSKVVGDDGKPLRVYRGQSAVNWDTGEVLDTLERQSEFPAFHKGEAGVKIAAFFTDDPETASRFAKVGNKQHPDNAATFPVYLAMQKPFVIDAAGGNAGDAQFGASGKGFRDAIKSGDYDGVIIKNTADEGNLYVALKPTQIKSATGNRGTFDPDSPKITEGRWITLNGGSGEDGNGGSRVYIDDGGEVQAGPAALKGKELDDAPGGGEPASKPAAAKQPKPAKPQSTSSAGPAGKSTETITVAGSSVTLATNPSPRAAKQMLARMQQLYPGQVVAVRMAKDADGNVYAWDGMTATHDQVSRKLKTKWASGTNFVAYEPDQVDEIWANLGN